MRSALLALAVFAAPAVSAAHGREVEALLDRGLALRDAARDAEAHAVFDLAWARCRCAEALAQRGLAAMALATRDAARWLDAERDLAEALTTPDGFVRAWERALRGELERARRHIGVVVVAPDIAGARVSVDDGAAREVPTGGSELRLVEGAHTLVIDAPGRVPLRREVAVRGGERARIEVLLAPEPVAVAEPAVTEPAVTEAPRPVAPTPHVTAPPPARREVPLRWLVGGGVALLVGAGATVAQQALVGDFNGDACLAGGRTRAENCGPTGDAADAMLGVAVAGYVTGAALIAVGAARWARRPEARAWQCAPTGAGIACGGRF